MSKEIDFPISELYKKIILGCFVFIFFAYQFCEGIYRETSYYIYLAGSTSYIISSFVCLWVLFQIYRNNFESTLLNYFLLSLPFIFVFFAIFPFNLLFLSLIAPPIPSVLAIPLGTGVVLYIYLSIKRSIKTIENCPAVIKLATSGFLSDGKKTIIKKKAINTVDDTINKYPFKFIELFSTALPILILIGLAMVGGVYKLSPNPDLMVRFFCAALGFLISPPLIFMMVYTVYLNYVIPKRLFGNEWKNVWREVE
ncbi:hypothetical protein HA050_01910 [Iodobacter sp. HSC-16F04]|uniref:Uncharacterized protein n=1 Tax=Iodobacter violaceini TaxID=3044271 RepID=A0ABX0KS46_9NEIS|nr:hypothetical protein [Iodobacter violacea]NHQ84867.1 hypothetical protein [Iodobacter violacea]